MWIAQVSGLISLCLEIEIGAAVARDAMETGASVASDVAGVELLRELDDKVAAIFGDGFEIEIPSFRRECEESGDSPSVRTEATESLDSPSVKTEDSVTPVLERRVETLVDMDTDSAPLPTNTKCGSFDHDFEEHLLEHALSVRDSLEKRIVAGNGNCLFSSVGRHTVGVDSPQAVRDKVVQEVRSNPEVYREFGIDVEDWCSTMSNDKVWGDGIAAKASSRAFGRPLIIFRERSPEQKPTIFIPFGAAANSPPMYVTLDEPAPGCEHYDPLMLNSCKSVDEASACKSVDGSDRPKRRKITRKTPIDELQVYYSNISKDVVVADCSKISKDVVLPKDVVVADCSDKPKDVVVAECGKKPRFKKRVRFAPEVEMIKPSGKKYRVDLEKPSSDEIVEKDPEKSKEDDKVTLLPIRARKYKRQRLHDTSTAKKMRKKRKVKKIKTPKAAVPEITPIEKECFLIRRGKVLLWIWFLVGLECRLRKLSAACVAERR